MCGIASILSKQSTMTRWYECIDCGAVFQETVAVSMIPVALRCPPDPEGCGKLGFIRYYSK